MISRDRHASASKFRHDKFGVGCFDLKQIRVVLGQDDAVGRLGR